jgi:deoxyribodipyrimidine photolyase
VLTAGGPPYTVFTPYKNAWLKRLTDDDWRLRTPARKAGG